MICKIWRWTGFIGKWPNNGIMTISTLISRLHWQGSKWNGHVTAVQISRNQSQCNNINEQVTLIPQFPTQSHWGEQRLRWDIHNHLLCLGDVDLQVWSWPSLSQSQQRTLTEWQVSELTVLSLGEFYGTGLWLELLNGNQVQRRNWLSFKTAKGQLQNQEVEALALCRIWPDWKP